jgi:hypothetical protein
VDHDLVAFARGAGIDPMTQRRLRDEGEGVGLLVLEDRRYRGNVHGIVERLRTCVPVQGLARRLQGLHEHRARLWL